VLLGVGLVLGLAGIGLRWGTSIGAVAGPVARQAIGRFRR